MGENISYEQDPEIVLTSSLIAKLTNTTKISYDIIVFGVRMITNRERMSGGALLHSLAASTPGAAVDPFYSASLGRIGQLASIF